MIGLTPELLERIKRIAKAEGKTPDRVLCEAVEQYWVRWGCNKRLKAEEW